MGKFETKIAGLQHGIDSPQRVSGKSRGAPTLGGGEGGLFCASTGVPNVSSKAAVKNHSAVITSLVFHTLREHFQATSKNY